MCWSVILTSTHIMACLPPAFGTGRGSGRVVWWNHHVWDVTLYPVQYSSVHVSTIPCGIFVTNCFPFKAFAPNDTVRPVKGNHLSKKNTHFWVPWSFFRCLDDPVWGDHLSKATTFSRWSLTQVWLLLATFGDIHEECPNCWNGSAVLTQSSAGWA